jgi:hypothetical protein
MFMNMIALLMLAMAVTGAGGIDINGVAIVYFIDSLSYNARIGDQGANPLGVQRFDRAAAHSGTDDGVDFVPRQLRHRMTGAVTVVGISVLDYFDILVVGIDQCKKRSRTKMFTDDAFQTGVVAGWHAD